MRIGSLFSGIGGLELGLERAGVGHTVWQVERDEFCRKVLARHWPDAVRYEDVTTVDWSTVEPVEVLCGGFPCQPFSIAGLRRGVFDERWGWPWFEDAVRVLRPRFVVVENVAALLADSDAFGVILSGLSDLGFDAEWSVVSACSVGAPHLRRRLFVVAHRPDGYGEGDLPHHQRQANRDESRGSRRRTWGDGWLPEPAMDRVAYGLPSRVVRAPLFALGNAVVPQVAEVVGRRLLTHLGEQAA